MERFFKERIYKVIEIPVSVRKESVGDWSRRCQLKLVSSVSRRIGIRQNAERPVAVQGEGELVI